MELRKSLTCSSLALISLMRIILNFWSPCSTFLVLRLQVYVTMPSFMWSQDSDTGPYLCKANILPNWAISPAHHISSGLFLSTKVHIVTVTLLCLWWYTSISGEEMHCLHSSMTEIQMLFSVRFHLDFIKSGQQMVKYTVMSHFSYPWLCYENQFFLSVILLPTRLRAYEWMYSTKWVQAIVTIPTCCTL